MIHEIKLLKIHKRHCEKLIEQKAKVGPHNNVAIDMEIEDIENNIAKIEAELERRLQSLREKAAIYGLNADPSITIEIEDIEEYFKEKKDEYI